MKSFKEDFSEFKDMIMAYSEAHKLDSLRVIAMLETLLLSTYGMIGISLKEYEGLEKQRKQGFKEFLELKNELDK
jgi:hypothetical protein